MVGQRIRDQHYNIQLQIFTRQACSRYLVLHASSRFQWYSSASQRPKMQLLGHLYRKWYLRYFHNYYLRKELFQIRILRSHFFVLELANLNFHFPLSHVVFNLLVKCKQRIRSGINFPFFFRLRWCLLCRRYSSALQRQIRLL